MTDELVGVSQTFLLHVTRPLGAGSGDETRWVDGAGGMGGGKNNHEESSCEFTSINYKPRQA